VPDLAHAVIRDASHHAILVGQLENKSDVRARLNGFERNAYEADTVPVEIGDLPASAAELRVPADARE